MQNLYVNTMVGGGFHYYLFHSWQCGDYTLNMILYRKGGKALFEVIMKINLFKMYNVDEFKLIFHASLFKEINDIKMNMVNGIWIAVVDKVYL